MIARPTGSRVVLLAFLVVALASLGCSATIGDGCVSNRDCGYRQECDTSPPGGYCTVTGCEANNCPSESWCASFHYADRDRTYCLRKCKSDGDCRGGTYRCRLDLGTPGGVCYVAPVSSGS